MWSLGVTTAMVKLMFLLVFVLLALTLGNNAMPDWSPANPSQGFPWIKVIENQFWIAFAFSGWNAAVYTAGEFRDPGRDVPRAMTTGLVVVGLLYLAINWVFVANLTPADAIAVFTYEETRITLAHLIADDIFGHHGGKIVSVLVIIAFLSAISAMMRAVTDSVSAGKVSQKAPAIPATIPAFRPTPSLSPTHGMRAHRRE